MVRGGDGCWGKNENGVCGGKNEEKEVKRRKFRYKLGAVGKIEMYNT